jgi:hypothetical protein
LPSCSPEACAFIATAAPIKELIERAYGIGMLGNRPLPFASIEGLPSWSERFDTRRMPRQVPGVPGNQQPPTLRAMLQQQLGLRLEPRTVSYD